MQNRTKEMDSLAAASLADEAGLIRGRAADGTPMKARIAGKSKAQQLREAARARVEKGG